ncbi:MAG: EamA family transporter [Bacillota bacterium]|jgi:transporter family protein
MNKAALWALLAALCYGIAPIFEKVGLRQAQPLNAVFIRALITTVFTGCCLLSSRSSGAGFGHWSLGTWLAIILSGVVGVLLAQVFYFHALGMGEVSRVAPIAGAWPLFAALLAAVFLAEPLTPGRVFGIVLVFLGVLFLG